MDRLTIAQCIKIIKTYEKKNDDSATDTYRALRGDYDLHNRATKKAIGKIVNKFEEPGVVILKSLYIIVSLVLLKISLL